MGFILFCLIGLVLFIGGIFSLLLNLVDVHASVSKGERVDFHIVWHVLIVVLGFILTFLTLDVVKSIVLMKLL